MHEESRTVRSVAWETVFPWHILFRTFGIAVSPSAILLGTLGVLLSCVGWWMIGFIFGLHDEANSPPVELTLVHRSNLGILARDPVIAESPAEQFLPLKSPDAGTIFMLYFQNLKGLIGVPSEKSLTQFCYYLAGTLWTFFIWGIFGGAISRKAALVLTRQEQIGFFTALGFSIRRIGSYFSSPLYPMSILIPFAIAGALVGLVCRLDVGFVAVSVLWGLGVVVSFLMVGLIVGLAVGWPMMVAAVSVEGTDSFDAVSRSFAYVFQKWMRLIGYGVGAWLLSILFVGLVSWFCSLAIQSTEWSLSWGTGSERIQQIKTGEFKPATANPDKPGEPAKVQPSSTFETGRSIIRLSERVVLLAQFGVSYALFFTMATAIYLLRRRDVDESELDEVYQDREDVRDLPVLKTNPDGTTTVVPKDLTASKEPADSKSAQEPDEPVADNE